MQISHALCLFILILPGCSNSPVNSEILPGESNDAVSGNYFLHGTKITHMYAFPWPSWGGEEIILSADTSQVAFTTFVKLVPDKMDTLQFYGLKGLNAGQRLIFPPDCSSYPPALCGYAKFENSTLEFNYREPSGYFTGTGTLRNGKMSLNSKFEYRPTGIYYVLTGVKADE